MARIINATGLHIIKMWEGLRLEPYSDIAGKPTIGYGHLIKPGEKFDIITQDMAEELLKKDVHYAETAVSAYIFVPLTDNQFSALVSLVYNEGNAPLLGTLGHLLNTGDPAAAEEFLVWNKAHVDGILVVSKGLARRREAERALFLTP